MSENSSPTGNNKLTTMFLIVLGVHVVIIMGLCVYTLLKGDSAPDKKQQIAKEETKIEEREPALAEATQIEESEQSYEFQESSPALISQGYDAKKLEPAVNEIPDYTSSMPSASDSVWAEVKPIVKETKVVQEAVSLSQSQPRAKAALGSVQEKFAAAQEVVAPKVEQKVVSYTVRKGDTLSGIAKQYGTKVRDIKLQNGLSGDMIKIGQKLDIPTAMDVAIYQQPSTPVKALSSVQPAIKRAEAGYTTYVVKAGDTLWRISHNHGTKPDVVARLNGLADPTKIKVGTKLRIPVKQPASVSAQQEDTEVVPFRSESMSSEMAMLREGVE